MTPFLPGDSLLFAAGALAADPASGLNVWIASGLIFVAAFLGDTLKLLDRKIRRGDARGEVSRLIKQKHLDTTNEFFENVRGEDHHSSPASFRSCGPSLRSWRVSGAMNYRKFMSFNVIGAFLWVALIVPAGWFFATSRW